MLRLDVLGVIMAVYSMEDANFFLFCLDDAPPKWACCAMKQNSAKATQLSHGIFGIGEFVFFSRLRNSGVEHM